MTAVEEHIDQCSGCRALLAGLVRTEATDAWYAGQRLGRYVLVEPIGHGGMGAVFRARQPNLGRLVALKVIPGAAGAKGLEVIRDRRPKLVILDIGLPGDIDGLEVCRTVRATSSIGVIMLTARDDEIDRVLGLELGADDYVTKPFSVAELVLRVQAVLRRSRLGAEIESHIRLDEDGRDRHPQLDRTAR